MRKVKYAVCFMISALIAAFLHYTLPQHDIVRITGSYNRVTTVGSNKIFYANSDAGTAESTTTRDIRFIEAVRDNGNVIVYRNEDTGWIWPPYFKWDSSNVQAEASNLKSDKDAPIWVSITHYGWRMSWISIYPNAVSISAAAGPGGTDVEVDARVTKVGRTLAFMDVTLRTKGGGKVVATGTHCKFLPNSQTSSKL